MLGRRLTFSHERGARGALSADQRHCGFPPALHHGVNLDDAAVQIPRVGLRQGNLLRER
jgi:hypothetical protein